VGQKHWSGPTLQRRLFKMQSTAYLRQYQCNILPVMLSFPDASDFRVEGIMQRKSGDHWHPFSFFSKKLTETVSHYSTFDREL
jgi:hypothetical protein